MKLREHQIHTSFSHPVLKLIAYARNPGPRNDQETLCEAFSTPKLLWDNSKAQHRNFRLHTSLLIFASQEYSRSRTSTMHIFARMLIAAAIITVDAVQAAPASTIKWPLQPAIPLKNKENNCTTVPETPVWKSQCSSVPSMEQIEVRSRHLIRT